MDSLTDVSRHLTSLGLAVRTDSESIAAIGAPWPPSCHTPQVETVMRHGRQVYLDDWSTTDGKLIVEDPCRMELCDGEWGFANSGIFMAGGFNHDIVRYYSASLDEMTRIVERYYLCSPIVLHRWVIPIHQHPAWRIELVERSIANATVVIPNRLGEMLADARSEADRMRDVPDKQAIAHVAHYCLYECKHTRNREPRLFLRYDCSEAFLCEGFD